MGAFTCRMHMRVVCCQIIMNMVFVELSSGGEMHALFHVLVKHDWLSFTSNVIMLVATYGGSP